MARKPRAIPSDLLSVYLTVVGPKTWRSVKVAVDTGATYTILPPDVLLDIGYDPAVSDTRLELSTANGLVIAPVLRVREMKCLGLTLKQVEVVTHHLPPESPVEGLLGLNVLCHYRPFQTFRNALRPFTA